MPASQETTRTRFDRWAPGYDRNWSQTLFFDRVHRAVLGASADLRPRVVLDVGCGTGRLLVRARNVFSDAQLVGVDVSPGMIEVARRKPAARFRFEVAAVEQLPFDDGTFDLVLSTISFHHWMDHKAGLREVARVLRWGGRFVLADPYVGGPFRPALQLFSRMHGPFRTRAELRRMFGDAGLRVRSQRAPAALAWSILLTVGERG